MMEKCCICGNEIEGERSEGATSPEGTTDWYCAWCWEDLGNEAQYEQLAEERLEMTEPECLIGFEALMRRGYD
jgi:hypothetical protein